MEYDIWYADTQLVPPSVYYADLFNYMSPSNSVMDITSMFGGEADPLYPPVDEKNLQLELPSKDVYTGYDIETSDETAIYYDGSGPGYSHTYPSFWLGREGARKDKRY